MIRNNPCDISRYVPDFVLKDQAFAENCGAQSAEHELLRQRIQDVLAQFYVDTATWGLDIWEDTLALPRGKDAFELRRARVKSKLKGTATTTTKVLEQIGAAFVACEKVSVLEQYADYFFKLQFTNATRGMVNCAEMVDRIEELKPAHLGFGLSVQQICAGPLIFGGAVYTHQHITVQPAAFNLPQATMLEYIGQAVMVTNHVTIGVGKS